MSTWLGEEVDWGLLYFVVTEIAWQPDISVAQYKLSNLTASSSESRVVGYFLVTDSLSQNIQYNGHHFIFVFALHVEISLKFLPAT